MNYAVNIDNIFTYSVIYKQLQYSCDLYLVVWYATSTLVVGNNLKWEHWADLFMPLFWILPVVLC